ncbi:MAG: secretion protein HlyD [Polaromonas sp.]|nr:secretion protein HlyD [Polaromonas sp.]
MKNVPMNTPVGDSDPSPDLATAPPSNTRDAARLGLWVLGLGFGGFLLWASLAPLDEGVPTHGMVTLDTKRKAVQHLSGGIVKAVLVGEGEMVTEGQPLLELDANVANANHEAVRQRYLGLRAMQGRLLAEQTGAKSVSFHPDLIAAKGDALIARQMNTQLDLLQARRSGLAAELGAVDGSIQGQRVMIQTYTSMLQSRTNQLRLVQQELDQTRPLVEDGYVPRNRLLELERMVSESQTGIFDLTGQVSRARQAIAELEQRKLARQQDYRKEVESQLADVTREVESDVQKLVAVKADLERTQIRSPATGQVVGLAVQSVGAVVQPGQKLMDVVPNDEPLLLETRVEPHLIDRLKPGLIADVRFTAFAHSPQLVVDGEVVSISHDLLVDQHTGVGYYLARVRITEHGMAKLGQRRLQPGMPAEVIVKTGERSMLKYLLSPLTKRLAASLKEE